MASNQIKDVKIPVQVMIGGTELTVEELAKLSEGSIFPLNKLAGEPVDVLASDKCIAKGEVVVIDENFGIRITEMASTE